MAAPGKPRRAKVRRGYAQAESEQAFLVKTSQLAKFRGWLVYHTHRSDRSEAGFPDLFMVRAADNRIVIAELKAEKAPARVRVAERAAVAERPRWLQDLAVTHEQATWLEALHTVATAVSDHTAKVPGAPAIDVYVWRPSSWPEIERALK